MDIAEDYFYKQIAYFMLSPKTKKASLHDIFSQLYQVKF